VTARALVVFGDGAGLWWLKWLRRGFRHCFVAVETSVGWVVIDPLSDRTRIGVVPAAWEGDLAQWYEEHKYKVVECDVAEPITKMMPWRPYSCVEEVKRVLGIRSGRIHTPWQLFKYLSR
jgi:hypothetical protein